MNGLLKIDMQEVTRLTRAGKLAEAMALLQGRQREGERETSSPRSRPAGLAPAIAALRAALPRLGKLAGVSEAPTAAKAAAQNSRFEERLSTSDAGSLSYKVYVPSGYTGQPLPLVVMLHGCTQDPDDFAAGTGMNAVAEEQNFLVAYPRQTQSANMNKCWNWFNVADQRRGRGEPALIAGVALEVMREFAIDPRRVYVAGLSAGGAAAAIMGAAYPDMFAAVGIHSGLACGAARDMQSAFAAMAGNAHVPPRAEGPITPTIVFHGDADRTVSPVNAEQVVAQLARGVRLERSVTLGETPDGVGYTRILQSDASGKVTLEQWVVHGAGHAWSGGSAAGSFADPRGPDASREMARFFSQHVRA